MIKYIRISVLNPEQRRSLQKCGYYLYDLHENRIELFASKCNKEIIVANSSIYLVNGFLDFHEFKKNAEESNDLTKKILPLIEPLKDVAYKFHIIGSGIDKNETVWTNKGLKEARKRAVYYYKYTKKKKVAAMLL